MTEVPVKKLKKVRKMENTPLTKGVIQCNADLCAGCRNCMLTCSISHEGIASLELARIQMNVYTQAEFDIHALPCLQCTDPQCMYACPRKAIYVDEKTGARVVDEDLCVGCGLCNKACPYEVPRIRVNKAKKKAFKCDLCGGDPACIKMCPSGALRYVTNPNGIDSGFREEM